MMNILENLKIKLETFSFRCKVYDLKITYTQVYCSGNQEYSSHVISVRNYTRARSQMSETCLGCVDDGDFTKWLRRCAHRDSIP